MRCYNSIVRPDLEPMNDESPQGITRRLRVLIADDDRDCLESLSMLLEMHGEYELRRAINGLEAVEIWASFHPDVGIIDIGMPGLNGYEVARRLRREEWGANAVLIAGTAWGQDQDKRDAADAGFDFHLTKPIDFEALQSLLADAAAAIALRPPE